MNATKQLKQRLARPEPLIAPLVLDALLALVRDPQGLRHLAERLPPPFVVLLPAGGLHSLEMSMTERGDLGYELLVDTQSPLLAQYHALRTYYRALRDAGEVAAPRGTSWSAIQEQVHRVVDLERMLRIERETVENR